MTIDDADDAAATAVLGNGPLALDPALSLDVAIIDAGSAGPSSPAFIAASGAPSVAGGGRTVRVSTDAAGGQGNGDSYDPAVSLNLRYVAFDSFASNLVPGDINATGDVFVRDLATGALTLASADATGTQGNGPSLYPALSAGGRTVAFQSDASNLTPGDANGTTDIFVKDLRTGTLTLASANAAGTPGNGRSVHQSISGDGRTVAFQSDASNLVPVDVNGATDIFIKDLRTGQVTLASADAAGRQGNAVSYGPSLSADSGTVAFSSGAATLVPGVAGGTDQVFARNLRTGAVTLVSADAGGAPGNGTSYSASVSGDGRYVAFGSFASNLVPGDTNGQEDVFVKDLRTGQVTLVSADAAGADGNGSSGAPAISENGRFVVFESGASNMVPGDANRHADIFLKDLWTGGMSRVATNPPANDRYDNGLEQAAVTNTGAVAFASRAGNVVPGDTNGDYDIFFST